MFTVLTPKAALVGVRFAFNLVKTTKEFLEAQETHEALLEVAKESAIRTGEILVAVYRPIDALKEEAMGVKEAFINLASDLEDHYRKCFHPFMERAIQQPPTDVVKSAIAKAKKNVKQN